MKSFINIIKNIFSFLNYPFPRQLFLSKPAIFPVRVRLLSLGNGQATLCFIFYFFF